MGFKVIRKKNLGKEDTGMTYLMNKTPEHMVFHRENNKIFSLPRKSYFSMHSVSLITNLENFVINSQRPGRSRRHAIFCLLSNFALQKFV